MALTAVALFGGGVLWLASTREPARTPRRTETPSLTDSRAPAETLAIPTERALFERTALGVRKTRNSTVVVEPARAETAPDPRKPRTESEYLAELRALARTDVAAFETRCDSVLSGTGPACEQFATLRAVYELQRPGAAELLARAVATLPRNASPQGDSVPRALVQWLAHRAAFELPARATLDVIVWGDARVDAELRCLALRERLLSAPPEDLADLMRRVHAERDSLVHSAGLACLDERDGLLSSRER